jgi:hypothetical protein
MVLSKTERPEVIGRWINGGRKVFPTIDDIPAFVTSWKKWWALLQPKSRVQKGKKWAQAVDTEEKWEELMKGSINGFFNIVVSLALWWASLKTAAQQKVYLEMVDDVAWALDMMIAQLGTAKKHTLAMAEVEDNGKRKR